MSKKAHGFEAQLQNWNVSSTRGITITLYLADEKDLEPFKQMTLKAGKQAGQRLMVAVSRIGDQEQEEPLVPITQESEQKHSASHFPPGLCGLAVKWSNDSVFANWAWVFHKAHRVGEGPSEEWVEQLIKMICNIDSRKELDTNKKAAEVFNNEFRLPYQDWLTKEGAPSGG